MQDIKEAEKKKKKEEVAAAAADKEARGEQTAAEDLAAAKTA